MKKQIAALALALTSGLGFAQEAPGKLGFVGVLGVNSGGDTLVSGKYSNGDSYDIQTGSGVMFAGGLTYAIAPAVTLQATIGYESDSTSATNGKISFTRKPMELLGFYSFTDHVRLGLGVRRATGARLSSSGVASSVGSADYNASTGVVLEGQYFFNDKKPDSRKRFGLYARYVTENFTTASSTRTYSGNHLGLGLVGYF